MFDTMLYAQTPAGGQPSAFTGIIPLIIIFAILYIVILMPEKKRRKQHQQLVSNLKGGERVMTAGGIFGTVTRVMEDRFEIEVDKNTKLQVSKTSISGVIDPTQQGTKG